MLGAVFPPSSSPESIKSEVNEPEPKPTKPYITTDKANYTLGDTITVSGKLDLVRSETVGGDKRYVPAVQIYVGMNQGDGGTGMTCWHNTDHRVDDLETEAKPFEYYRENKRKCNIDEDGNFELKIPVTDSWTVGTYKAYADKYQSYEWTRAGTPSSWKTSDSFIVQ